MTQIASAALVLTSAGMSSDRAHPRRTPPVFFVDLGDDLGRHRVDLLIGHGLLARLHGHGDRDRLLAVVDALALIDVEHGDVGDQLLVDALRGAHDVAGLDRAVDDEGEVARHRLERGELEHRLGAGRLLLRRRNAVEDHLEGHQRAVGAQRFQRARMQFAEIAEDVLRPDLDRAGTSRMQPACAARHDLQRLHRRAGRGEHRECIGLGVERIGRGRAGPMPPDSLRRCEAAADAGGRDELVLGAIAFEDLADLEQRDIGKAAIAIGLHGRDQAGQQARPHVGEVGGDRIGEHQLASCRRRTIRPPAWR